MSGFFGWLASFFARVISGVIDGWQAREAFRDQGAADAAAEAAKKEVDREERSRSAEQAARDAMADLDPAHLDRMLGDRFGPNRRP